MLTDKWTKSSFSLPQGENCVEHRFVDDHVEVRDSKAGPAAAIQRYTRGEWAAHLAAVRDGECDLPTA